MTLAPDVTRREGLEEVLAIVREAAREAAALVLAGYRTRPSVEHKGAVDLVTDFDRASELLLRQRLGSALPFTIVGEEHGGHGTGPTFFVDPVDGTTNFVHGHPFWCISVGLVLAGAPVLGVVLSPPLGVEWSGWIAASGEKAATRRYASNAIAGEGRDLGIIEETCAVSANASLSHALLATGFPYDRRPGPDDNFGAFIAIKRKCQAVRRCGSAALDLCLVADGTYEGYWERKLRPWDIAAGIAIVRAAGGRVTDFEGGETFISSGRVVATNGAIHEALSSALAAVDA